MERGWGMVGDGHQLSLFDLESIAKDTRRQAKLAAEDVVPSETIARRLLGPNAIERVPRFSATGMLVPVHGQHRIFLRRNAPDENFTIAHELGHWSLRKVGYCGPNEERYADVIGAAIVATPEATRRAHLTFGENLAPIAKAFRVTQSFVVLRLAEVLHDERALVSRQAVRIRSSGAFAWPDDPEEVRSWERSRRPPQGVKRSALRGTYDRGRVAFLAA